MEEIKEGKQKSNKTNNIDPFLNSPFPKKLIPFVDFETTIKTTIEDNKANHLK